MRNVGGGDLDLPRYVVQHEKAAEGGLEVLARVRQRLDGMGRSREYCEPECGAGTVRGGDGRVSRSPRRGLEWPRNKELRTRINCVREVDGCVWGAFVFISKLASV